MIKYIAFLRGINVGGHNVKMEYLREIFAELGYTNILTYIQTGNIFFESDEEDKTKLTANIEALLLSKLGYDVATFVRTIKEFEAILASSPFNSTEPAPDTRHLIVFISSQIPDTTRFPLLSPKGDYEIIGANECELYVKVHLINGKFQSSSFIEKNFNVATTGRFFHTLQKMLAQ
jgi:uncharacterized protein (DUF1697 family)